MSQLSKSLEKRIQELTSSIEAQKAELDAYERVLHMEMTKENRTDGTSAAGSANGSAISFTGNKTSLVAEIVKSYGSEGTTPKDVDAHFSARGVQRSKNLIYNTLSYLVAQKKLIRRNGKYFATASTGTAKKSAAKKTATPTKRRLSPEGLKRIKEALRKRWAAKRAADAAASSATTKKAAKKKSA